MAKDPPNDNKPSPLERYLSKQKAEKAAQAAKEAPPKKKSRLSLGSFAPKPTPAPSAPVSQKAPAPAPEKPGRHQVVFEPHERPQLGAIERPEGWTEPQRAQPASLSRWEEVADSRLAEAKLNDTRLTDADVRAQEAGVPAMPPPVAPSAAATRTQDADAHSIYDRWAREQHGDTVAPVTHTSDSQVNAEFGPRLIAVIIDGAILAALTWPVRKVALALIAIPFAYILETHREGLEYAVTLAMTYAYYGYFYPVKGASPGKLLLGLEVTKPDGVTRIGPWQAFFREAVGKLMSAIPFFMGYVIVLIRADHRALHDLLFDTRVIRKKS